MKDHTSATDLKERTRAFAMRVIRVIGALERGVVPEVLGKQLLRCATSAGANYRAACKARSRAEFIAKMGIVEEEADETIYWLELLADAGSIPRARLESLIAEANELLSITIASIRTARGHGRS